MHRLPLMPLRFGRHKGAAVRCGDRYYHTDCRRFSVMAVDRGRWRVGGGPDEVLGGPWESWLDDGGLGDVTFGTRSAAIEALGSELILAGLLDAPVPAGT